MITKYPVQWGDIVLDCIRFGHNTGRNIVPFEPVSGDGGLLIDKGPLLRSVTVDIEWVYRNGNDDPAARREEFIEAYQTGQSALLWHPLDAGSYAAKVGRVGEDIVNGNVVMNVEFMEDRAAAFEPVRPDRGASPRAGADTVETAADTADDELAAIGESTTTTTQAKELSRSWADTSTDTPVDARRVYLDSQELQSSIGSDIRSKGLADDLRKYRAYVSMIALAAEVGRAAEATTKKLRSTFETTVGQGQPLIALMQLLYGAEQAVNYYAMARALNRIDTPFLIPAGTVLTLPTL